MRLLIPALLLATACRSAAPAGLTDADKAAIQRGSAESEARFNAVSPDFKAYAAAHYSADAVMMPQNGESIMGSDAIGTWMASYPKMSNVKFAITDMDGSGSVAYVQGLYEMDVLPPGTTTALHDKGKYLEIWRKQSDGSWKVTREIFNSDLPLPAPPPVAKKKKP